MTNLPPEFQSPEAGVGVWRRLTDEDLDVLHDALLVLTARETGADFMNAFIALIGESFDLTDVEQAVVLTAIASPWSAISDAYAELTPDRIARIRRMNRTFGPILRRESDQWVRPHDWHNVGARLLTQPGGPALQFTFVRVDGVEFELSMDEGSAARFLSRLLENALPVWKLRPPPEADRSRLQQALEATDDFLEEGAAKDKPGS